MTETDITALSQRLAFPDLLIRMLLRITVDEPFVWNFEFGSLEFIWDLSFVAWNFYEFAELSKFGNPSQDSACPRISEAA
jgi:hypothetical protein